MTRKVKGIAMALFGPGMWGVMGIFVRPLSEAGFSNMEITFVRCIICSFLFFLLVMFTNPSALKVGGKGILASVFYGLCAYSIGFTSYNIAVTRISVSIATVLMFTAPVWVTIMGMLFFRDKPGKNKIIAIAVCFVGAILAADVIGTDVTGSLDPLGIIMSLVNGMGVASQLVIPRFFDNSVEKDTLMTYGLLTAAITMVPFVEFDKFAVAFSGTPEGNRIALCLVCLGVLCTFCANGAYVKATNFIDTLSVSILSADYVVVGFIVSFLVFGESVTPLQVAGAVIICVGALYPNIMELSRRSER